MTDRVLYIKELLTYLLICTKNDARLGVNNIDTHIRVFLHYYISRNIFATSVNRWYRKKISYISSIRTLVKTLQTNRQSHPTKDII